MKYCYYLYQRKYAKEYCLYDPNHDGRSLDPGLYEEEPGVSCYIGHKNQIG